MHSREVPHNLQHSDSSAALTSLSVWPSYSNPSSAVHLSTARLEVSTFISSKLYDTVASLGSAFTRSHRALMSSWAKVREYSWRSSALPANGFSVKYPFIAAAPPSWPVKTLSLPFQKSGVPYSTLVREVAVSACTLPFRYT